ncbi:Protein LSM14 A [Paramecium bursaria]
MISLTTKSNIRYLGDIYVVDKIRRTIFLKNVKCLGTEKRSSAIYIPPAKNVQPLMEFNNDQILEIKKVHQELDLNQHPGAPIPFDKYPRIQQPQRQITDHLNQSFQDQKEHSIILRRRDFTKTRFQSQSPQQNRRKQQVQTIIKKKCLNL